MPGGGVALPRSSRGEKMQAPASRGTKRSAPISCCEPSMSRSIRSPPTPAMMGRWSPTRSSRHAPVGYNANTGEYVDMYKAGIVDPMKVTVRPAERGAIAAPMLTTEALVTNLNKDDKKGARVEGPERNATQSDVTRGRDRNSGISAREEEEQTLQICWSICIGCLLVLTRRFEKLGPVDSRNWAV